MARNNCARPGSDIEANVQTEKHAKVRNWVPKSGNQCTKALQKNKATTESNMQQKKSKHKANKSISNCARHS